VRVSFVDAVRDHWFPPSALGFVPIPPKRKAGIMRHCVHEGIPKETTRTSGCVGPGHSTVKMGP
jgi:hypothetical protein